MSGGDHVVNLRAHPDVKDALVQWWKNALCLYTRDHDHTTTWTLQKNHYKEL
jgi:hypothetical protein